jgi:hypothetical protein
LLQSPFDLHVLGTPPAFILSQDQTLRIICFESVISDILFLLLYHRNSTGLPITLQLLRCCLPVLSGKCRQKFRCLPISVLTSAVSATTCRARGPSLQFSSIRRCFWQNRFLCEACFIIRASHRLSRGSLYFFFGFQGTFLFRCPASGVRFTGVSSSGLYYTQTLGPVKGFGQLPDKLVPGSSVRLLCPSPAASRPDETQLEPACRPIPARRAHKIIVPDSPGMCRPMERLAPAPSRGSCPNPPQASKHPNRPPPSQRAGFIVLQPLPTPPRDLESAVSSVIFPAQSFISRRFALRSASARFRRADHGLSW